MTRSVLLQGLQSQPLGSYLASLGVLRVCAAQLSSVVRGAFTQTGFLLEGTDESELLGFLLDRWAPASVLTPWNNASGFYPSSKGRLAEAAMKAITTANTPRFSSLVHSILRVRALVQKAGYQVAPEGEEKAAFIARLRGALSDDAVAWLDAVAVVDADDVRMMPVLGSGGNEGVLDYSGLFLRSIQETLLSTRERSSQLLEAALFGRPTDALIERPAGQFTPGSAGGFNTGFGFESKDLPNNPWLFLLLIEGTIVWASSIASRQQGTNSGYRFAVSPFTVRHKAAGYGSAGDGDPKQTRAEVWVPVWRKAAGLTEVKQFIAEGRAEVGGKHASDSIDFVDAVSSLGVDRGVDSFVRYTFIKRRGDSYLALPASTLEVSYKREVDLLRQLDGELAILDRFLARFPGEEGPPAMLVALRRAIDEARFDAAARGGHEAMLRLVRAIGALEIVLSRRDPGKEPKLPRLLGGLGAEWVDACGESIEVNIAAALASISATGSAGSIRSYLAPTDLQNPTWYAPSPRTIAWSGLDLSDRLANVLQKRLLDIRAKGPGKQNPTWGARTASLNEVSIFLSPGALDEKALEELFFGFAWVQHQTRTGRIKIESPPLPRSYALLKLLFLSGGVSRRSEKVYLTPDASIVPLLRAGRISDAVAKASSQLRARKFQPRRVTEVYSDNDAVMGRRLAASLLIPVLQTEELLKIALLPETSQQER